MEGGTREEADVFYHLAAQYGALTQFISALRDSRSPRQKIIRQEYRERSSSHRVDCRQTWKLIPDSPALALNGRGPEITISRDSAH